MLDACHLEEISKHAQAGLRDVVLEEITLGRLRQGCATSLSVSVGIAASVLTPR